jgi:hypothetical protein
MHAPKKLTSYSASAILIFLILFLSSVYASDQTLKKNLKTLGDEYFLLLFTTIYVPPEIVEVEFFDNGTFTLTSDYWDGTVTGTYGKNRFFLNGKGSTGIYYDMKFEELVEISYAFTSLPLINLRRFFMLGTGARKFTFPQSDNTLSESFFFLGPGI